MVVNPNGQVKVDTYSGREGTCEATGKVVGSKMHLEIDSPAGYCTVGWQLNQARSVTLSASKDPLQCQEEDVCGERGTLFGTYESTPAICQNNAQKARQSFKLLYDKKQYAAALATLKPVLDRCSSLFSTHVQIDIRNDLAVTHAHMKDFAACQTVLKPIRAHALDGDRTQEIDPETPMFQPGDRISDRAKRAIQTNLKLCGMK